MGKVLSLVAVVLTSAALVFGSVWPAGGSLVLAAGATALEANPATEQQPAAMQAPAPVAAVVDEMTALEDEVIRLTNIERAKHGLLPVRKSTILTQAARAHNADMIANNFVSHTGSNGFSSALRAQAAGYATYGWERCYVGENIAAGLHTPQDAINGWLNSPTHKANMLRPEYREIGVGVAKGGRYGTYWTQDFGSAPNVFPAYATMSADAANPGAVTLMVTNETVSNWGSMGPAVAMMISADPAFRGADWQPFASSVVWSLPQGGPADVVYVQLRDAAGNVSVTEAPIAGPQPTGSVVTQ